MGASLVVTAPTGLYYVDKPVNIGANRWAFKPEVGVSYNSKKRLYLDFYAGVWLFTANTSFLTDTTTRTQDPLTSLQLHASYTIATRFWAAIDGTWYSGGAMQVDGAPSASRQENSRVGALLSYGFTSSQSLKLSWSFGASARVGQDFTTIGLAYQYLWF